jgi:predicted AAA+ superfamily ATPase
LLFKVYLEKKEAIKAHLDKKGRLPEVSAALIEMLNEVYNEYLIYGGYPRVAISKTDEEKKTVLRNIYSTYFLREMRLPTLKGGVSSIVLRYKTTQCCLGILFPFSCF